MNDCGAPLSIHHYLSGFDCKRPCGSDTISIPQFSPYSGQSHGRAGAQAHLSLYSPVLFVFYLKYAVSTSFSSHFTLLGICCVWKLKHYALVWWLFFFSYFVVCIESMERRAIFLFGIRLSKRKKKRDFNFQTDLVARVQMWSDSGLITF